MDNDCPESSEISLRALLLPAAVAAGLPPLFSLGKASVIDQDPRIQRAAVWEAEITPAEVFEETGPKVVPTPFLCTS